MPKVRGLGEIVIWVHDMEKSLRFYGDLLGLEVMSPPDLRGARFLRAGSSAVSCPQQIVLVPLPPAALVVGGGLTITGAGSPASLILLTYGVGGVTKQLQNPSAAYDFSSCQ